MSKRPRGGHKQDRQRRDLEQPDSQPCKSHAAFSNLAHVLLTKCFWGGVPFATDVQEIARAAMLDGLDHPAVNELASLGAFGRNKNHIHGQLFDKRVAPLLPSVQVVSVPGQDRRGDATVNMAQWG
jgi:hypothetical protein